MGSGVGRRARLGRSGFRRRARLGGPRRIGRSSVRGRSRRRPRCSRASPPPRGRRSGGRRRGRARGPAPGGRRAARGSAAPGSGRRAARGRVTAAACPGRPASMAVRDRASRSAALGSAAARAPPWASHRPGPAAAGATLSTSSSAAGRSAGNPIAGQDWAGRSVNSVPTGSTGAPGSIGQIGLRGIPAKIWSTGSLLFVRARPASRRASPGRPSVGLELGADHEAEDVVRVALEVGRRRLAGAGQVARPPARFGEIPDAFLVEAVPSGQALQLGPREAQRAHAHVDPGEDEIGRPLVGIDRDGVGRDVGHGTVTPAASGDARGHGHTGPARRPRAAARRP